MPVASHGNQKSVADTVYRVFLLAWPASTQIYGNKRKRLHKKRVQPQRIGLGHQHGRRVDVWGINMAAVTSCENALLPW